MQRQSQSTGGVQDTSPILCKRRRLLRVESHTFRRPSSHHHILRATHTSLVRRSPNISACPAASGTPFPVTRMEDSAMSTAATKHLPNGTLSPIAYVPLNDRLQRIHAFYLASTQQTYTRSGPLPRLVMLPSAMSHTSPPVANHTPACQQVSELWLESTHFRLSSMKRRY